MERLVRSLQDLIVEYNINLINVIFGGFTVIIVILGTLLNLVESHLPAAIRQSFRYGKHCYTGHTDPLVSRLEVPKGWFKHFYVFAFAWSMLALFFVLKGFVLHAEAPEYVMAFLDLVAGGTEGRQVRIDSSTALIATVLMTLQCGRRFYETNFVQIFSKKSKINLSHYILGYLHYFGAILALLTNTEGFVRGSQLSPFSLSKISLLQYFCIFIFHFSWTQQYKANMALVNLRKDAKTGQVKTENHLLPSGGFFDFVSSPHMFFEVVMYVVLLGLLWRSNTWCLVSIWVFSNQLNNALLTHAWYRETFSNYPKNRRALIPFVL